VLGACVWVTLSSLHPCALRVSTHKWKPSTEQQRGRRWISSIYLVSGRKLNRGRSKTECKSSCLMLRETLGCSLTYITGVGCRGTRTTNSSIERLRDERNSTDVYPRRTETLASLGLYQSAPLRVLVTPITIIKLGRRVKRATVDKRNARACGVEGGMRVDGRVQGETQQKKKHT